MTQIEYAKKGIITSEMEFVLGREEISEQDLIKKIIEGKIVILSNNQRKPSKPCAVGDGVKTKVNANIGLSPDKSDINYEIEKFNLCLDLKVDAVMDLSVSKALFDLRKKILEISSVSIGTVPIYELYFQCDRNINNIVDFDSDDFLKVIESQIKEGVDFLTIHCGINKKAVDVLKKSDRIINIVSRGGAMLFKWMELHNAENPLFERFGDILDIAKKNDVTLSLGDALRPGSILDATDNAQLAELNVLGKLARKALKNDVQVIIEGPGHVPINQIEKNIELQKEICNDAPFYVLGPLTTDIAAGYDHISSAIGAAMAAYYGADFICYVTPAEHLRLPTLKDVKNGIIASRIAAHSADVAKGIKSSLKEDELISVARREHDWKKQFIHSIDPKTAKKIRQESLPKEEDVCTMCSEFCALKLGEKKK